MHYTIISYSYKNSSVQVRESLCLANESEHHALLKAMSADELVNEVMLISTCNRIEILATTKEPKISRERLFEYLAEHTKLEKSYLQEQADLYTDEGAIHHIFSVAASLDSLVVGETQIVGQLRDALRFSSEHGYSKHKISRIMDFAFKCAAEIRQQTQISSKPVSIASIAVAKAEMEAGSLKDRTALVVGSGEMSRLACQYLAPLGAKVVLLNRTKAKALEIQEETPSIKVEDYETLPQWVEKADCIFTATSAPEAIISIDMIEDFSKHRYWFDLAVPRDIEPFKHSLVSLFVVDDLEEIAQANRAFRNEEAKNSYAIVSKLTHEYYEWLKSMEVEPFIKSLYLKAFDAIEKEQKRALKKGFIPEELSFETKKFAQQAAKRFLHEVAQSIRQKAHKSSADQIIDSLQELFTLEIT